MKTEESLLHLNMLIFRVLLFGLAGALIVALAISKPPPSFVLGITALVFLTVVFLISRGKTNVAIRSAACCLWLMVPTIILWKGRAVVLALLLPGLTSAIFGIMALRGFSAKKREEE